MTLDITRLLNSNKETHVYKYGTCNIYVLYVLLWKYKQGHYDLSVLSILVNNYYHTVIGISSCLCHYGATCEWLLTNLIPAVSGHYCLQTCAVVQIFHYIYMCCIRLIRVKLSDKYI